MKVIAVVVLVLLFLAPPVISRVADDKLIVPGQRIGKWTLDMTIDDLLKMNGPRRGFSPNPSVRRSPLADLASPTYEHHWYPLACFYALTRGPGSQKVIALGVGYPFREGACQGADAYRTAKGPTYTPDALKAAHGKPTAITVAVPSPPAHEGFNTVIFDQIGMAAMVTSPSADNITVGFLVFRPGTAKSIWKY